MKAPHKYTLAIALLTGLTISSAHATLINVDFNHDGSGTTPSFPSGTMTGAAATGTAGDTWNPITTADFNTATALVDSTNTASTATITVVSTNVHGSYDNDAFAATDAVALMADYININDNKPDGTTATVSVNNLALNSDYIIHLFGVGDAVNQDTLFDVFGANEEAQSTLGGLVADLSSPQHYVTFTGNTGANGEVDITWTKEGTWTAFNGFQLQVASIPEPSATALLAGMFGLTWVMLRRRA